MSFSSDIKNDLCRYENVSVESLKAELLGLLRMSGMGLLRPIKSGIFFRTKNAALARRIFQLLKRNFGVQIEIVVSRSKRLRKENSYQVIVHPSTKLFKMLDELGFTSVDNVLLVKPCNKSDYLRGAFLAIGSVNKPSTCFHLELVALSEQHANILFKFMDEFSLKVKKMIRRGRYVIYIKEADSISRFLGIIGANGGVLDFENILVMKEMRNYINRVVNCETANLNKVVKTSIEQMTSINYIDNNFGLGVLPSILEKTARARINAPNESISYLAFKLGGISKSTLSQRFKKINEYAKKLGMDDRHG